MSEKVLVRNLTDSPVKIPGEYPHWAKLRVEGKGRVMFDKGEINNMIDFGTRGVIDIFKNYLSVDDKDVQKKLGIDISEDVEYTWTVEDVDDVLTDAAKIDNLEDALNFAPQGIKDLIVERAVKLRIPNMTARELIKKATGSDITMMIDNMIMEETAGKEETTDEETPKTRKAGRAATKKTGRKAATAKTGSASKTEDTIVEE